MRCNCAPGRLGVITSPRTVEYIVPYGWGATDTILWIDGRDLERTKRAQRASSSGSDICRPTCTPLPVPTAGRHQRSAACRAKRDPADPVLISGDPPTPNLYPVQTSPREEGRMRAQRASRRSRSEREALRPTATDYRSVAKRARSASFATDRCASCTRTIERPVPGTDDAPRSGAFYGRREAEMYQGLASAKRRHPYASLSIGLHKKEGT